MGYILAVFSVFSWIMIKDTNGLSVNIYPTPALVEVGDSLEFSSTITKTDNESWKSFEFFVNSGALAAPCGGMFKKFNTCFDAFGCPFGFNFNCNFTHFNLRINNVNASLLRWSIFARVTMESNEIIPSNTLQIPVKVPLQGVSLTPNGTTTTMEKTTQVFQCFAKSFPISSLRWKLNDSLLPTLSPPKSTIDTITSTFTYIADKDDNEKTLSCSAIYGSTLFTGNAVINVLYRPTIDVSPKHNPYNVLENTTNLQFICNVTGANPAVSSLRWNKDDTLVSANAIYDIPTIRRSHAGRYTCNATNSVGSSDPFSAVIQLYVLYGIEIDSIIKRKPTEGNDVSISCSGKSYPAITDKDVTWTKENNATFNMNGIRLLMKKIQKLDKGIYICSVVINLIPTVGEPLNVTGRTTVEVDVLYVPTVTISPNYTQYNVIENTTNLQFVCSVLDANPTVTSFIWYKNGSKINGFNGTNYTIPTVHRTNNGRYTCAATNSVGASMSLSTVNLSVLYGIEIDTITKEKPIEGTRLTVICSGQSYPAMTDGDVTWTKQNNVTFNLKGKRLVIDNTNRLDSGTYVCSVVIKLIPTTGQPISVAGRTTVEVDVIYVPTVTISPNYTQYKVIENTTNLQFVCSVIDANPTVTSYNWYKDGSKINDFHGNTYTIPTVHRTNNGRYTCDATNSVGASIPSSTVNLSVLYGIELYPISKQHPTEGSQYTITCGGQSYPVMTLNDAKWSKQNNNTFRAKGLQLVISHANRLDSGTYVCTVVIQLTPTVEQPVNVSGTTSVVVDVLYRPDVAVSPEKTNPFAVKENTTDIHLTCNVTSANPAVKSYTWYKDGVKVLEDNTYTIPTVSRSHTGSYTCDATNIVGSSDPSTIQLNVLYGVSLRLSDADVSINETESWELACIGDGNPLPELAFAYIYNSTTVGEQNSNVTSIKVENANCMDTGLYMCSGNNTIGEPVFLSANIKVFCTPRTYNNVNIQDIFINGTDATLNISTTFISYPLSNMVWYRELPSGNLTDLRSEFMRSTMQSHLPYETISILQKDQLEQDEFGIYLVQASNIHGSFLLRYRVISKRAPDSPTNITAKCDITSIRVTWISRFNGGENQTFRVNYVNNNSNKTTSKGGINDKGENEIINEDNESFTPDTLYSISLVAENVFGSTTSTEIANCKTKTNQEYDQHVSQAFIGGISGSISSLLIVVFVIGGLYLWRRRKGSDGDKEPIKSDSKETDEDEEGLKANPLYVTSGDASKEDVGPVYGVVKKQKHNRKNITCDENNDEGPVYSQVQKSNTHGKQKQKEKQAKKASKHEKCNDIELASNNGWSFHMMMT
ncbi:unnamed protein product [Mytilus coruscus]|uniref:Ig-like domain-containing protein n=1 Tax=Mytilus coruscus TaxID=42192 RepID=A0A6J8BIN2_MYTCO|nr:unnamed protein product [Mytilus coruscus]